MELARRVRSNLLPLAAAAGIGAGIVLWLLGSRGPAGWLWAGTTLVVLGPLALSVARGLLKGRLGVDVIALLAMAGSLLLGEYLAGAVVALMLSGGQALEQYAGSRARRELSALLERSPRVAHRLIGGGIETVPIEQVKVGDVLGVRPGEVVPVDGLVLSRVGAVDESALTGEAGAIERVAGDRLQSGSVNAGAPLEMRATNTATQSTYAGILRLVRQAQEAKAPFVRLADRYALAFLPLTVVLAGLAWALSGQPVRALAVLVVATPCPLILAAPVAIVAGISRAARRGIIVKGGGALEALAQAQVLLLDKTGTLTIGQPRLADVVGLGSLEPDDILCLAASLEQLSSHPYAAPIVNAAREQGMRLSFPTDVEEAPGAGVKGMVDGHSVRLGKRRWVSAGNQVPEEAGRLARRTEIEGTSSVFVAIDGVVAGALLLEDSIRPDTPRAIRTLRQLGIRSVVMITGDHPAVAASVGEAIGADRVLAERSPAEKVEAVRLERGTGPTVMVGDGINDAAALAAADVGVAMGARGASAASESADVVLLVDRLDRVAEAMAIAKGARRIALQSVLAGMGLSLLAMVIAAGGGIAPVGGAVLQEGIDLAVILNALRALRIGSRGASAVRSLEVGKRFRADHRRLLPGVGRLRAVADQLDRLNRTQALVELQQVSAYLNDDLLPHEEAEGATLYPVVAELLGGDDPTGPMARAHMEIAHLARRYSALVSELPADGPASEDILELRRLLYSLHAILQLHFSQEDEAYISLFDEPVELAPLALSGQETSSQARTNKQDARSSPRSSIG